MGGDKPKAPEAPDLKDSLAEGVDAYVQNLPEIIDAQAKYQPTITQSAINDTRSKVLASKELQYEAMRKYSDDIMGEALALERRYGPTVASQYIDNMRAAAPGYFKVRDAYEKNLSDDLALGNQLSDEQTRMVQQATRAGQNARGNILGQAPSAQETMRTFLAGEGMRDKRMSRAGQYAMSSAPGVSFGASPSAIALYQGQPYPQVGGQQLLTTEGFNTGNLGVASARDQYNNLYKTYERQAEDYVPMWQGILQGGMQGASAGGMAGGPWGAVAGGIIGGVAGGASTKSRV